MDPIVAAALISLVGVIVTAVLHTRVTRGNASQETLDQVREETQRLTEQRLRAFAEQLGNVRIALAECIAAGEKARAERDAALAELEKLRRPRSLNTGGRS